MTKNDNNNNNLKISKIKKKVFFCLPWKKFFVHWTNK